MFKRLLAALGVLFVTAGPVFADGMFFPGGGVSPGGAAGGDLSGSYPNPTVAKLNGNAPGSIPESYIANLPTDLANLAAAIQTTNAGNTGSYLVSGCGVIWSGTNYVYNVSACTYYIGGTLYTSPATNVTLAAADATNDRYDDIVVNTSSTATNVTGTAAVNPTTPSTDPATQLSLIHILVTHNTTAPANISNENVYLENTEWTCAAGSNWNCADTANPYAGTKDIKGTTLVAGNAVTLTRSSTLTLNAYQQLSLWVAPVSWPSGRSLIIRFLDANSVQLGNAITIVNGSYGFVRTSTSYQLLAIPLAQFSIPAGTNVKALSITAQGTGGTFTTYVDNIIIQSNINTFLGGGTDYSTQYRLPGGLLGGTGPGTANQVLVSGGSGTPPTFSSTITSPTISGVTFSGSMNLPAAVAVNSSGNIASTTRIEACTSGASAITRTLPAATGSGRIITLIKIDSGAGTCIFGRTGADALNGGTTRTLSAQYKLDHCEDEGSAQWICQGDGT